MRGTIIALLTGLAMLLVLSLLPAPPVPDEATRLVQAGNAILARSCMRCHAIGSTGSSPHPDAPPFRTLHRRYPVDELAEAMAEGITTGHPDMPEFVFSTVEIEAILAYLDTIADAPPPPR